MDFDSGMQYLSHLFSEDFPVLSILRVKCSGCGATHAVLPADVWPFHTASLPLVFSLLLIICKQQPSDSLAETLLPSRIPNISWQLLSYYINIYLSFRERMLKVLIQAGSYSHAIIPSDHRILSAFLFYSRPPESFILFCTLVGLPLFFTRCNTDSYFCRFLLYNPA